MRTGASARLDASPLWVCAYEPASGGCRHSGNERAEKSSWFVFLPIWP